MDGDEPLRVSRLVVYPVKSCGGFETGSWRVDRKSGALLYDREWAVLGSESAEALTQVDYPVLCRVAPTIDLASGTLTLSDTGGALSPISLTLPADSKESVEAASAWFSRLLGRGCSWARFTLERATERQRSKRGFRNVANFLVVSQRSLDDLAARIPEEKRGGVDLVSFRPSLLVSGGVPYQEDRWREIKIGNAGLLTLRGVRLCDVCPIMCVDKRSATMGDEPLRTLQSYRKVEGKGVLFGLLSNCQCPPSDQDDSLAISVGDAIHATELGEI